MENINRYNGTDTYGNDLGSESGFNLYYENRGYGRGAGMRGGNGQMRGGFGGGPGRGQGMHRTWNLHDIGRGFIGIKYMILKLAREKEVSGVEIMDMINQLTRGCYRPSSGNVYPALSDLVNNGYLSVREENTVKYYKTTKKGIDLLDSISKPLFANNPARENIENIEIKPNDSNDIDKTISELEDEIKKLKNADFGNRNKELIDKLEETVRKLKNTK